MSPTHTWYMYWARYRHAATPHRRSRWLDSSDVIGPEPPLIITHQRCGAARHSCHSPQVRTDRRDAEMLARLWRAGELTSIWAPDEEQEAMRDLIRTRKQARDAVKVDPICNILFKSVVRHTEFSIFAADIVE